MTIIREFYFVDWRFLMFLRTTFFSSRWVKFNLETNLAIFCPLVIITEQHFQNFQVVEWCTRELHNILLVNGCFKWVRIRRVFSFHKIVRFLCNSVLIHLVSFPLKVVDTGSSIHDPIRNSKIRAENQRKISFIIVLGVDVGHELSQNRPLLEVPDVAW